MIAIRANAERHVARYALHGCADTCCTLQVMRCMVVLIRVAPLKRSGSAPTGPELTLTEPSREQPRPTLSDREHNWRPSLFGSTCSQRQTPFSPRGCARCNKSDVRASESGVARSKRKQQESVTESKRTSAAVTILRQTAFAPSRSSSTDGCSGPNSLALRSCASVKH